MYVRFLDSKQDIREEFLGFIPLQRITGAAVSEAILQILTENNIPTCNMHGKDMMEPVICHVM